MTFRLKPTVLGILAVAACVLPSLAEAQITANFTGGNGTTPDADQYKGAVGTTDGWASAWATVNSPTGTATIATTGTVTNATPLNNGGNYLATTFAMTGVSGNTTAEGRVGRTTADLGSNGNTTVDFNQLNRTTFSFRADTLATTEFNAAGDYVELQDRAGVGTFAATTTWNIRAYGAVTGNATALTWAFYNGARDSAGVDTTKYVSTGITLAAGTLYTFTIDSNPVDGTWIGTISDGTNSYTSSSLGWNTTTANGVGNSFVVDTRFNGNTGTNTRVLSFDGLSFTAIPETSTCVGGGLLALLVLARLRPGRVRDIRVG